MRKAPQKFIAPIIVLGILALLAVGWLLLGNHLQGVYYTGLLEQAQASGRNDTAADAIEHLVALNPTDIRLRQTAAELLAAQGTYSRAEYHLKQAIALGGREQAGLFAKLSALYAAQDKLLDAVGLLDGVNNLASEEVLARRPAMPAPNAAPGTYSTAVALSFPLEEGQHCYYSLTEEYPSLAQPYTEPIVLRAGETTVRAVTVSAEGVVSPLFTGRYVLENVNFPVAFTEPSLEALVRAAIGKPDGELFTRELAGLTTLEALEEPLLVESLADLALLPGLVELNLLGGGQDCDISAAGTLTGLKILRLEGFGIDSVDAQALSGLTGLTELRLPQNSLTTLDFLASMPGLTALNLSHNSLIDIDPIQALTALKHLNLENNSITSLTPLETLTAMETLRLRFNRVTMTRGLGNMKSLKTLDLSENNILDLNGLEGITALTSLDLSNNRLEEIMALKTLRQLQVLNLSGNQLSSILPLADVGTLEELYIQQNSIDSLAALDAMHRLRLLNADRNEIATLEPLRGLESLEELRVENNSLKTLDPLLDCPELKSVYSYGNSITNTSALLAAGIQLPS